MSHLTSNGSVYLFMDGHHSHSSLELMQEAKLNHVQLFCLRPNRTHSSATRCGCIRSNEKCVGTYNQTVEAGVQGTKCVKGSVPRAALFVNCGKNHLLLSNVKVGLEHVEYFRSLEKQ